MIVDDMPFGYFGETVLLGTPLVVTRCYQGMICLSRPEINLEAIGYKTCKLIQPHHPFTLGFGTPSDELLTPGEMVSVKELPYRQFAIIQENKGSFYGGHVIMRIPKGFVSLNRFHTPWGLSNEFEVKPLPAHTSITIQFKNQNG